MEPPEQPAPGKIVLHVGCGRAAPEKLHQHFRTQAWREVRLDVDPAVKPDIVSSIVSMPQVKAESVDAIWSSHNLEHLYAHEVPMALREFVRVLRPGAFALVTLPDLQRAAQFIASGKLDEPIYESPAGPIAAIDILFGHRPSIARGNVFMAHRTGFTGQTLRSFLDRAGFERIRVERKRLDLWAIAYKPSPTSTRA